MKKWVETLGLIAHAAWQARPFGFTRIERDELTECITGLRDRLHRANASIKLRDSLTCENQVTLRQLEVECVRLRQQVRALEAAAKERGGNPQTLTANGHAALLHQLAEHETIIVSQRRRIDFGRRALSEQRDAIEALGKDAADDLHRFVCPEAYLDEDEDAS